MTTEAAALARAWMDEDPDPETRAELEALLDDAEALADRFAGTLEFGTAGIRGVLGAGPMRMNRVLVRRVSAGVAGYYGDTVEGGRERGVVICYDGRRGSRVFSEDAARVFLGAGWKVYLGTGVLPTPVAAFAVTHLGAAAGVMVTASHNPPEYNGYKVYAPNGAQIIPPHDTGIAERIAAVGRTDELPMPDLESARADGRLVDLGDDLVERYLEGVDSLRVHPDAASRAELTLAYTPLHGVGAEVCERALKRAGFERVHTVAEQREPDGAFPTVRFPNPEEDGAMDRVLSLADSVGADLALANDPDADRLAVALPVDGEWKMLTGDQIGVVLAGYLMSEGPSERRRSISNSLVSSQMLEVMAQAAGIDFIETLTGFKWIANAAMRHTAKTGARFVMGYEEALGYTVGELVRDKDGISAVVLFAELAAFHRAQGRSVWEALVDLYRTHGLFLTEQRSLTLPGSEGLERIAELMRRFREQPLTEIGGHRVLSAVDLLEGTDELPPGNVLVYRLEGNRRVIVRPSGTEPKLKSYYEVCEVMAPDEGFADAEARAEASLAQLADAHQELLS